MRELISGWLENIIGVPGNTGFVIAAVIGVILIAALSYLLTKLVLLRVAKALIARTTTRWDDLLVDHDVLRRVSRLAPLLVVYWLSPLAFESVPLLSEAALRIAGSAMVVIGALALSSVLDVIGAIYGTFEVSRHTPIKGFVQVSKVILFGLGGVVVLAILLDKTPVYLLSGLGALTAVLLIVFKDPILGLVGGIQLSANKMVAIGDWIEMPTHAADGEVVEIALTTVKVRNWDKTITTVPTYDLVTHPFRNWRSMQESGGRRIKRAVHIDVTTIRFCDSAMLERFSKIRYIAEYLECKQEEIARHNESIGAPGDSLVNGRRLTNVGTFRAYLFAYLRNHPNIRQDMTFLVRQLEPGEHGLPIEVYVFTDTTEWADYEAIQSDIFDHVLAAVPAFDLRVFQRPSSADVGAIAQRMTSGETEGARRPHAGKASRLQGELP